MASTQEEPPADFPAAAKEMVAQIKKRGAATALVGSQVVSDRRVAAGPSPSAAASDGVNETLAVAAGSFVTALITSDHATRIQDLAAVVSALLDTK